MGQLYCPSHCHLPLFLDFFSLISSSLISFSFAIVFIFLLPDCFLFYHLQFLSNLSQYSWLYCLSNHLNSFLVMNLPGNSPLLNVSSLCSYLTTSSISCWYSFLNSLIVSFAFFKFSLPSYVSDSTVNPFQHTRYLFFLLTCHLFNIFSTFYSSFPLIITGAGCSFLCPSICPTYCCILLTLTIRCIFIVLDSYNSTAFNNTIFLIL